MPAALSPVMFGRDAELALLHEAMQAAGRGRGRVVLVTGAAGIGKTRLVNEFAASARRDGRLVVTGRASSAGAATAFRPLREALLQATRGHDWRGLPGVAPWLRLLEDLLEPVDGDRASTGGDDMVLLRGEAIRAVCDAVASASGLVVLLEDLHLADRDTLAVIEYLADNLGETRVLCLATVRSESRSGASDLVQALDRRAGARVVTLTPLSREDAWAMALACLPSGDEDQIGDVVAAADGVPLLVEELLSSTGMSRSFQESVTSRLAAVSAPDREIVEEAALLGRTFDWRLLAARHPAADVAVALRAAVGLQLVEPVGADFRFRHALTRDAIEGTLLPDERARRASTLLDALGPGSSALTGDLRGVAIELAVTAGRDDDAAVLLIDAATEMLGLGALEASIDTSGRACRLAVRPETRHRALERRIEALAEAGRVDEAQAESDRLLSDPAVDRALVVRTHLALARASAQAARWAAVAERVERLDPMIMDDHSSPERQQWQLLTAELALARGDTGSALRLTDAVLSYPASTAEARCGALCLRGRSHRASDLAAAHADFERALAVAEVAGLSIWRLRALHELGTIELFDHAGTARLMQARAIASDVGAVGLVVVLDVQLAAAHLFNFDPDGVDEHARSAVETAGRMRLDQLRATAWAFLSESAGLRGVLSSLERYALEATAAAPGDREIEGSVLGGRGVAALLSGDRGAARDALVASAAALAPLANAGPGLYRGLLPLLLAVEHDPEARAAVRAADAAGIEVNRGNTGLLRLAEAVLVAQTPGERATASVLVARGARALAPFPVWAQLGLMLTAEAAIADSWGDPVSWLQECDAEFTRRSLTQLAEHCRALLGASPSPLDAWGVTHRESEVWGLLAEGLTNRAIATRLSVSPRTVEKHVENLLRKTGTRTRTQLARAPEIGSPPRPDTWPAT